MYEFKISAKVNTPVVSFEKQPYFNGAEITKMKVRFSGEDKYFKLELWAENKDAYSVWAPLHCTNRAIYPSWINQVTVDSKATHGMPVFQYLNKKGESIFTFALSDASTPLKIHGGIDEKNDKLYIGVEFFTEPTDIENDYEVLIYCNSQRKPYYENLCDVRSFWNKCGYTSANVPEAAKHSLFSTWYCYQKAISDEKVFRQCILAKELGMNTVIIDDGWQTPGNGGGDQWEAFYTCGDWEPYTGKFPDMGNFINRLHNEGMNAVLWIALPFIGNKSKEFEFFKNKILRINSGNIDTGAITIPDPRYKEIRQWYTDKLTGILKAYNLDGFKLDFIDNFYFADKCEPINDGMDIPNLQKAVDALLNEIISSLSAVKDNLMIEFRQVYVGPVMQQYGNMFRVDDRAYGAMYNRINGIDLRLITDGTAIHSDMLKWDSDADVQAAADQLSALLFIIPQISMPIEKLSKEHYKMLKFYLDFIEENKDILQGGKLVPLHPEALYPVIYAELNDKTVVGLYDTEFFRVPEGIKDIKIVNASGKDKIAVAFDDAKTFSYKTLNCMGDILEKGNSTGNAEIFNVPHNGMLFINVS